MRQLSAKQLNLLFSMKASGSITIAVVEDGKNGTDGQNAVSLAVTPDKCHFNISSEGEFASSGEEETQFIVEMFNGTEKITEFASLTVSFNHDDITTGDSDDVEIIKEYDSVKKCYTGNVTVKLLDTLEFKNDQLPLTISAGGVIITSDGVTKHISRNGTFILFGSRDGVAGSPGATGKEGCLIRRSEWEVGKTYRNDSARTSRDPVTGLYIIDEVTVSSYNGGDGYSYTCKRTHTSTQANKPKETRPTSDVNWTPLNNIQPFKTSFADITKAVVEYLQAKQIAITDDNGQPYGAFGGGDYPLWFGGTSPETAVTKISKTGRGYFDGILRSRGVDMALTEIHVNEVTNSLQGFEYKSVTSDFECYLHNVDIEGEPYISAYFAVNYERNINPTYSSIVNAWIVLPFAQASIKGRVIEIYVPSYLRRGSDSYHEAIGVTALGQNGRWIDETGALDSMAGTLCTQWDGDSYASAVLCAIRHVSVDDTSYISKLRVICAEVRGRYKWVVLESTNVRLYHDNISVQDSK